MYNREFPLPFGVAGDVTALASTWFLREERGETDPKHDSNYGPFRIGPICEMCWMLDTSNNIWIIVLAETAEIVTRNERERETIDKIVAKLQKKFPPDWVGPTHLYKIYGR